MLQRALGFTLFLAAVVLAAFIIAPDLAVADTNTQPLVEKFVLDDTIQPIAPLHAPLPMARRRC